MACGIPPAQSLDLLTRGTRRDVAALHSDKSRITHWRSVRCFHIAFRELWEIDLAENGKRGEL
jgi:hypothetical protein